MLHCLSRSLISETGASDSLKQSVVLDVATVTGVPCLGLPDRFFDHSHLFPGPVPCRPVLCKEPFLADEESAHALSTRHYSDSLF
jgi:hypothetical protein